MCKATADEGLASGAARGPEGEPPSGGERLFVALALPDSVRLQLTGLSEPLHGVSWIPAENLHLTLRFLGEVPAVQIEQIEEHLERVRVESFILPVEGLGSFPLKGPARIVWAGVGSGHPHLFQLRQRLDDAVLSAGVDLDVRTFHPHVTLARCPEGAGPAASAWLRRHREFAAASFRVRAFDLMRSQTSGPGVRYSLRRRYPLY